MSTKPIHSPSYPSLELSKCIEHVGKIEGQYRTSSADREDAARLIGYSALSGPANKTLAALASYGLVERAGKGMMRVTPLAVAILHPKSDDEKRKALLEAAMTPPLFREIREQFPDLPVPPEAGVVTHLNRAGFNPSAVPKAAKAFLETARFVEELSVSESHGDSAAEVADLDMPDREDRFGGAVVGSYVQWESQGALQFDKPRRVRWVSDDGTHVAVEGSETGIPMNQVVVEEAPVSVTPPPQSPPPETVSHADRPSAEGFSEWFRAKVGADKLVTVNYRGDGEIGPREIQKMIAILEAQKLALED